MHKNIVKVVGVFVIGCLFLTGCGNKKSITSETFQKQMEKKQYTVQDVTAAYDEETTSKALIAVNTDFQVEFYTLKNDKGANSSYDFNKSRVAIQKIKGAKEKEEKKANYIRYTLETSKVYTVISKIDKTVLYVSTDIKYKKDVDAILKDLNY